MPLSVCRKCLPFMTNYQFFCKRCNPNGLESFNKKQASKLFTFKPFIQNNWPFWQKTNANGNKLPTVEKSKTKTNRNKLICWWFSVAAFKEICHTALANLMLENQGKTLYYKDKDIIPYIDKHWESLTTMPRRIKLTWHNTVVKTMVLIIISNIMLHLLPPLWYSWC